jgi:menaquinone-dependent protoporphyrinogen IX oxidase
MNRDTYDKELMNFVDKHHHWSMSEKTSAFYTAFHMYNYCQEYTQNTSYNSGYMVRKAKALLSQIAKATSYIRKRCTTLKKDTKCTATTN